MGSSNRQTLFLGGAPVAGQPYSYQRGRAPQRATWAEPEVLLAPPPTAPVGALEATSRAYVAANAAADQARRQARRPYAAPTLPGASGAQTLIRRQPRRLLGASA